MVICNNGWACIGNFELCLKVAVMETWGVGTGLCNTPYSWVGESMG